MLQCIFRKEEEEWIGEEESASAENGFKYTPPGGRSWGLHDEAFGGF